jgi:MATE family multidrug resistance protein
MKSILSKYKSDFSQNIKLALPIMLGQLGQITVYIADNMMVGRLGAGPLAAVSLAIAIIAIPTVIGMGIAFALPPLVSEADGANEKSRISKYFKHSLLINILIGVLSFFGIVLFIPLLGYLGQEVDVVHLAKGYLFYSGVAIIPMMVFMAFRSFADGMGETLPSMIAMIFGNIVNIGLNYVLIFGKFGFKAYGVDGAAIASVFARIAMIIVLIILLVKWKDLWSYIKACNFKKYEFPIFKKLFDLGIPTSLQMFFEISAFSGAALIMGMVSKNAQAAHQIAINIASITFMICTGLAMAATIRVGNQLGKRNYKKMRDAGISAIIQVILIMAVCSILFVLFRSYLPLLYIDDQNVIEIAVSLLVFAAIFQIPDGLQVTTLAALRGLQDVKVPTIITFISYYIFGIPISYITAITLGMGAPGVWLGLLIGLTISASLLTYRFNKLSNQFINTN